MSATAISILTVGNPGLVPAGVLARLSAHGWRCRRACTLLDGLAALRETRFDVVLAAESVSGGSGYEFTGPVMEIFGMLFIGIPLSEGYLWLPVVEGGRKVLGQQALNSAMLEPEMEMVATGLRENERYKEMETRKNPRCASVHPLSVPQRRAISGRRPRNPAAA
jgi:hypothetical protein